MYVGNVAELTPQKPAIIHLGETGAATVLTYADLDERSARLAAHLRSLGLRPGDGIAVLAGNHVSISEIYWAAQRSGLYYTPVNPHLSVSEVGHVIGDSGARVIFAGEAHLELVQAATADLDLVSRVALDGSSDNFDSYEAVVSGHQRLDRATETEGSAFLYSSGTTGRPKGVKRPRSGAVPGSTLFGMDPSIVQAYGLTEDSISLIPLPLYHSSGLTRLMLCQSLGCTTIIMERFDSVRALDAMQRFGVTDSLWVATMFVRMLQLPDEVRLSFDLSLHRNATVGSGPCPAHIKKQMIDWWGPIITEIYGGTEGNGMTRITSAEWLDHVGSVGRPVFGQVHVVDDNANEVPVGELGTIYFSGGRSFEYHNVPTESPDVFTEQGWSTLGDIGKVDADGYVYLVDRKSDMILVGGVNISPQEIESTLIEHPAVRDVAVIGVPDEEYGESVKAVVEPMPDFVPGRELEEALLAFCGERLPRFKVPRSVDFNEELPRHPTGKLYKRLVRAAYWEGHATKV